MGTRSILTSLGCLEGLVPSLTRANVRWCANNDKDYVRILTLTTRCMNLKAEIPFKKGINDHLTSKLLFFKKIYTKRVNMKLKRSVGSTQNAVQPRDIVVDQIKTPPVGFCSFMIRN